MWIQCNLNVNKPGTKSDQPMFRLFLTLDPFHWIFEWFLDRFLCIKCIDHRTFLIQQKLIFYRYNVVFDRFSHRPNNANIIVINEFTNWLELKCQSQNQRNVQSVLVYWELEKAMLSILLFCVLLVIIKIISIWSGKCKGIFNKSKLFLFPTNRKRRPAENRCQLQCVLQISYTFT